MVTLVWLGWGWLIKPRPSCALALIMAGPVENAAVYCFACGEDVTVATNRYNMYGPACEKALPIWKKLLDQHFQEANIDCSIDDVLLDDTGCCFVVLPLDGFVERSNGESAAS